MSKVGDSAPSRTKSPHCFCRKYNLVAQKECNLWTPYKHATMNISARLSWIWKAYVRTNATILCESSRKTLCSLTTQNRSARALQNKARNIWRQIEDQPAGILLHINQQPEAMLANWRLSLHGNKNHASTTMKFQPAQILNRLQLEYCCHE